MLSSLKMMVENKLSRLLADSRSFCPPPSRAESMMAPPESQAFLPEELIFTKNPFVSWPLLDVIHLKHPGFNENDSNLPNKMGTIMPPELVSPYGGSTMNDLSCNDGQSKENGVETDFGETEVSKSNIDRFQGRHINGSHQLGETSMPYDSTGSFSHLTEKSTLMSLDLFEFFKPSLPNIAKGCQWVLLYSTWKHGTSLHTLIRRSADLPGPSLLIVRDTQGAIFGGLMDSPLKPTTKRKYQGTNQTFVFTTIDGEPRIFRATGVNRYYYMCVNDVLAFGGGENYALALDEDLLHGSTGPCETFGNSCLAHNTEFELKDVEDEAVAETATSKTFADHYVCCGASLIPRNTEK